MRAARTLLLPLALLTAACGGRYMGLDPARLDASTVSLLERGQIGDKHAQLQLGMAFARGDGVPQDCEKAQKLVRQAAAKSGGTLWVYSPPVTKGGAGRIIPMDTGPERSGLPEAIMLLEHGDVCQDPALGRIK